MKIFTANQTRKADAYTIKNEPIKSIDLMERASLQVFKWLKKKYGKSTSFSVFCGPGNNGGDGLAVARMLHQNGFPVQVYEVQLSKSYSSDYLLNKSRLVEAGVSIQVVDESAKLEELILENVIIDAIFGSGLSREITGWLGTLISYLNKVSNERVSIDIASGLFVEDNDENAGEIFEPDHTLTFEMEKLAFQFPENQKFVGALKVLSIQLSKEFTSKESTSYFITSKTDVKLMHKKASSVAYKNTFGHALLVTGSTGKMGASVLCAKACLKSGAGLVTAHIPRNGNDILQISVPEVMTIPDSCVDVVSDKMDVSNYHSIGVGPGLGQSMEVSIVLRNILEQSKKPVIIDADAINVLSSNNELLKKVPVGSVFTPHLGEWKKMVGNWKGGFDRLQTAKAFCKTQNVFVVLKGAKSSIVCPDGEVYFNSTGNSGMATAGSGDVLTGILTGLLAQGYAPKQAAILGVYIHGLAGDLALKKGSRESVIASDIIANLGKSFKKV